MKRLLTTLVILTGLLGSAGAVWADAEDDFYKGYKAYQAGDYAEALKWYRKAAEQGYASAQYNLGNGYRRGKGVTQDYAEAVRWYRKAVDGGNKNAKGGLKKAESALEEQQEKIALEKAQKLRFAEANRLAEQGDAKAQLDLSEMYYSGEGVAQDHVEVGTQGG
jgi:TPR repeat protein